MLKRICAISLMAVFSAFLAQPGLAEAAEFISGGTVTVNPGEVIDDDLYAAGGTIVVRGAVNGDLVTAGGNINVEGTVNGDVVAAGGDLNITGPVSDDIRAAGGQIRVASNIGGDLVAAGGSLTVEGEVGEDLIAGAGVINVRGVVDGDAILGGGAIRVDGVIRGDAQADVDQLTLGPNGRIEGNLRYTSEREVQLEPGAQVLGQVTRSEPQTSILGVSVPDSPLARFVNSLLSQFRWFLGVTIVGLLLLWLFPRATRGVAQTPVRSPWQSLGLGLGILILTPIALIIVGVIAILIGGLAALPVLLAPGAAYVVLLTLAAPVIAILIGALILRPRSGPRFYDWKALLVGAAILAVIGLIPVLDIGASILTILFGFGAWALYLWRSYSAGRAPVLAATS